MIDNIITYNINWKNKTNINDTDANFWIVANIPIDKVNKINMVACTAISIPKTFYNILDFQFILIEDISQINITLPNGSYELKQFFLALQTALSNATLNNINYTVWEEVQTYYRTGRIQINATNNITNLNLGLFFNDSNDASYIMGFHDNITYNFTNVILWTDTITLNPDSTLYLNSNICKNYNNDWIFGTNNILCAVYWASTKFYWYIVQKNDLITNMKEYVPQNIYKFWLTNERGDLINLNGVSLIFEIKIFRYTDNYNFFKKISNIIDYNLVNENRNE